MFDILRGKEPKSVNHILNMVLLRARFNPQRHYEIYAVTAEDGIDDKDITEMFNNSPQVAADTIREKGTKIYSDRQTPKNTKIT